MFKNISKVLGNSLFTIFSRDLQKNLLQISFSKNVFQIFSITKFSVEPSISIKLKSVSTCIEHYFLYFKIRITFPQFKYNFNSLFIKHKQNITDRKVSD